MMRWIKNHIVLFVTTIFVIALLLPIGINALYLVSTDYEILYRPSEWTIFWGSYLGTIISAGVAFAILYIQRKDNKEENENNRKNDETQNENNRQLQLNILNYQQEKQWLKELKAKCIDYYNAFDQNDIIDLCNLINKNTPDALLEAKQLVNYLIDRNNKVIFALEFHFSKMKDKEEIRLLSVLNNYNLIYKALIYDVQYLIRRLQKDAEVYSLYAEIDEYEKRNLIPQVTDNRIVTILNTTDYIGKIGGLANILNKLFAARKDFSPDLVQGALSNLCDYEEEKINEIIKI